MDNIIHLLKNQTETMQKMGDLVMKHDETIDSITKSFSKLMDALNNYEKINGNMAKEIELLRFQYDCLNTIVMDLAEQIGVSNKSLGKVKRKITNFQKKQAEMQALEKQTTEDK